MRITRRGLLAALAAVSCNRSPEERTQLEPGAAPRFRLAICNETFPGWKLYQCCRGAIETGYTGIEIAPFTLSEDPAKIPASKRMEYRKTMESEGVEFVGLHALLKAPVGQLHITTPDDAVRERSWEYLRRLVDLCADLGDNGVMVLGSGKERCTVKGASVDDAVKRIRNGLADLAPHAEQRRVTILIETLAPHLCDILTSLHDSIAVVEDVGSPAVQSIFDTHNAVAEKEPHDQLIKKYARYIRHVHVNEMDGRHPGTGSYDFSVPLRALHEIGYEGWISLEVFQFEPSGEEIARESARHLRQVEAGL